MRKGQHSKLESFERYIPLHSVPVTMTAPCCVVVKDSEAVVSGSSDCDNRESQQDANTEACMVHVEPTFSSWHSHDMSPKRNQQVTA